MCRPCTGLGQIGLQYWERKWTQVTIPNLEAISIRQLLTNEKLVFANRVSLGAENTLKVKPHMQQDMANTKRTHWRLGMIFVS